MAAIDSIGVLYLFHLLLFYVQNPRTNWVSVVWKLGEICYIFKYLKLVFF